MAVRPNGLYLDGTLGGGGHAEALLERSGPDGRVLGLDRDPAALSRASQRLASYGERFTTCEGSFFDIDQVARAAGFDGVDGVVLDLGISSDQLDDPARGFSFMADGPLDMRMNPAKGESAADLVAERSEVDLANIIWRYGEEPKARRIASAIVRAREVAPVETTGALARLVEEAVGGRRGRHHPATRTFQALRIAVNRELDGLRAGLRSALDILRPGGRLAVISFHSLEDREVKHLFRDHAGRMESLHQGGARWVGETPKVIPVIKHPVTPGEVELAANPRARSAKLRVVEKAKVGHG